MRKEQQLKRLAVIKAVLVTIGALVVLGVACSQGAPAPASPSGGGAQPTATKPAAGQTPAPTGGGDTQASADKGKELFASKGCGACHAVKNVPGAVGTIGPALDGIGNATARPNIAGGALKNTPENMAKWLKNPPALKPGTQMPNLNLGDAEIASLVAFLSTLK